MSEVSEEKENEIIMDNIFLPNNLYDSIKTTFFSLHFLSLSSLMR